MIKYIIIFLLYFQTIFAQDYSKVDSVVKTYPKVFSSVDRLAGRIKKDFTKEDEKARAIFTWIATNIKYDVEEYLKIRYIDTFTTLSENEVAAKVLFERKGVCADYSKLYKVIAEKAGLEAVYISGFSKTTISDVGKLPKDTDHAWNAVKIAGEWKLLDVTWGAGSITDDKKPVFVQEFNDTYFFTKPEKFYLKHFPEDTKWLFVKKTLKEFAALPIYYNLDYEIVAPEKSVFRLAKTKSIEFILKKVREGDVIYFAFEGDEYSTEVIYTTEGDKVKFSVPLRAKTGKELTIYVNDQAVAGFKIYPF
jgi:transglutaminase/protease-like cytokinesis protein 3